MKKLKSVSGIFDSPMDYHLSKNKTLLYAYNHYIRHIEGFSYECTGLGSSPDFAYNTLRAISRPLIV
jgi:hypothetical protein